MTIDNKLLRPVRHYRYSIHRYFSSTPYISRTGVSIVNNIALLGISKTFMLCDYSFDVLEYSLLWIFYDRTTLQGSDDLFCSSALNMRFQRRKPAFFLIFHHKVPVLKSPIQFNNDQFDLQM